MERLYPPNIEGTIPAFCLNYEKDETGTTTAKRAKIVVPFSMNRAVSRASLYDKDGKQGVGFRLNLKSVYNNTFLVSVDAESWSLDPYCYAVFDVSEANLKVGQSYKVQIAYVDNKGVTGYLSNVGVVKCTAKPTVSIAGLTAGRGNINTHKYDYVGVYNHEGDPSEKVYSYCFNLYDNEGNLVETSGECLHDSTTDTLITESTDSWAINHDLERSKSYYIEYNVSTINNLITEAIVRDDETSKKVISASTPTSGKYRIMQSKTIDPEISVEVIPVLNYENGYVDVKLNGKKNPDGVEYTATGAFKILRSSGEENFGAWHEVLRFALYGQKPSYWSWRDLTVKQGVSYKYAIQQYSDINDIVSNRIESEPIYVDFEHAFLFDGEKQLKIKYNPKVANFKNDVLESKMDTIGSQYPFIFRNGSVKYKEFSISGLISCQMDEEFLFSSEELKDAAENLTGKNIAAEREFKLKVLEWLNNGKPKLFRSPSEGNYIVRLLNVSMTPMDTLGRMLHTFTSTAYEIAEHNYDNLSSLGLISLGDPTVKQLRWETVDLSKDPVPDDKDFKNDKNNYLKYKAVSLHFEGMIPGDIIHIDDGIHHTSYPTYPDKQYAPKYEKDKDDTTTASATGFDVVIGVTGSYIIDLRAGIEVKAVYFKDRADKSDVTTDTQNTYVHHQGSLTYAYYSKIQNRFDSITGIEAFDTPLRQFIGEHNILEEIQNVKREVQNIYWLHAALREVIPLYKKGDTLYEDPDRNLYPFLKSERELVSFSNYDPYAIYYVQNEDKETYFYYDAYNNKEYSIDKYSPCIYINGNEMSLEDTHEYAIKNPKNITSLKSSFGTYVELSYQAHDINYSVENYAELILQKNKLDAAYDDLVNAIYNLDNPLNPKPPAGYEEQMSYEEWVAKKQGEYETCYQDYVALVQKTLEEEEEAQGDVARI